MTMRTNFVAIGCYSRVGKDTFGRFIAEELRRRHKHANIKCIAFAYKLKQVCHELYYWTGLREPEFYETDSGCKYRDIILPDLNMTPVELWVKFGTHAVRREVYDLTWSKYLMHECASHDITIITDLRFRNEAECLNAHTSTFFVKVQRPGVKPRQTIADQSLAVDIDFIWDAEIDNCGTLDDLRMKALGLIDRIEERFYGG